MAKAFIAFHPADREHARKFMEEFSDVVTDVTGDLLCVNDNDEFVKDVNEGTFVQRELRAKYLKNSMVTIMLAGKCTWSARYVDWEIAASLRKDSDRGRNALVGIRLPYMATSKDPVKVPERFQANLKSGYAIFKVYPTSSEDLRTWITTALERRDTITPDNSLALQQKDDKCKG